MKNHSKRNRRTEEQQDTIDDCEPTLPTSSPNRSFNVLTFLVIFHPSSPAGWKEGWMEEGRDGNGWISLDFPGIDLFRLENPSNLFLKIAFWIERSGKLFVSWSTVKIKYYTIKMLYRALIIQSVYNCLKWFNRVAWYENEYSLSNTLKYYANWLNIRHYISKHATL